MKGWITKSGCDQDYEFAKTFNKSCGQKISTVLTRIWNIKL